MLSFIFVNVFLQQYYIIQFLSFFSVLYIKMGYFTLLIWYCVGESLIGRWWSFGSRSSRTCLHTRTQTKKNYNGGHPLLMCRSIQLFGLRALERYNIYVFVSYQYCLLDCYTVWSLVPITIYVCSFGTQHNILLAANPKSVSAIFRVCVFVCVLCVVNLIQADVI